MRFEACIFDLDGVLVDTARFHFLAWKRLADELGIHFTEKENERLKGVSRMDSLEIILEYGDKKYTETEKRSFAERKNKWYVEYISGMTPADIMPGTLPLLKSLRKKGIKTAVGSASKNTPLILERTGLQPLFDAVADGNIISKAKPDPDIFLAAARMLHTDPRKCIVFEDAEAGVKAALNAGMFCIGVGNSNVLHQAHEVIGSLEEINLEKLKSILEHEGYKEPF